jgi:hypothetical protein
MAATIATRSTTPARAMRGFGDALLDAVTAAVLAASDAEMHRELDPTDKA